MRVCVGFSVVALDAVGAILRSVAGVGELTRPDIVVRLHFNSRIDRERSRITLLAPDGKTRKLSETGAAEPDMLSARADGLDPGRYTLRWQVLAVDGHITRGDIPFQVAP